MESSNVLPGYPLVLGKPAALLFSVIGISYPFPALIQTNSGLQDESGTLPPLSYQTSAYVRNSGHLDRMCVEMSGLYLCCCCKHSSTTIMHERNLLHYILNKRSLSACSMQQGLNTQPNI